MVRAAFYAFVTLAVIFMLGFHLFWYPVWFMWILFFALVAVGIYDVNSTHNILRNYPIVGHLRYMLEFIRPEIQQYFIADNESERPFSRESRSLVYQRAKNTVDTLPFGTQHDITEEGYLYALHSLHPKVVPDEATRVQVGNEQCSRPYSASRVNISGMSFGAISQTAIMAMNQGAKLGNFMQSTGEGGLTPYHLSGEGDILWQIGTGYFGCRTEDGHFSKEKFQQLATLPQVKMIEIKLSQGAKPSHGGILPGVKITQEIATIRGVPMGVDCISPPIHSAFQGPKGLLEFTQTLRSLSGGKPIGFKLCVGKASDFLAICKAMLETNIYPDFITIDGAEGGTGAAPLEFSNRIGMAANEALNFVHNALVGVGLRDKMRLIVSGKIVTGFDMVVKLALGADMCNQARTMMFAVGCVQSLRCNLNTCPTGVATQDPKRYGAVVVEHKKYQVRNYHHHTIKSFQEILGAMGFSDPNELSVKDIYRRNSSVQAESLASYFPQLKLMQLLSGEPVSKFFLGAWQEASSDNF